MGQSSSGRAPGSSPAARPAIDRRQVPSKAACRGDAPPEVGDRVVRRLDPERTDFSSVGRKALPPWIDDRRLDESAPAGCRARLHPGDWMRLV